MSHHIHYNKSTSKLISMNRYLHMNAECEGKEMILISEALWFPLEQALVAWRSTVGQQLHWPKSNLGTHWLSCAK